MAVVKYSNDVQELYVAYFGRPADAAGLEFWTNHMANSSTGYQDISAAFSSSLEYQGRYEGMDNRAIVSEVYENLFGRVAEGEGVDFWAAALDTNTISIDNVVTQIADGAQGSDSLAYYGKIAVAMRFTDRLDTTVEQAAYSGEAANRIAMEYLGGVRDLASTNEHLDADQIDATIAQIVGTPIGAEIAPLVV